MLKIVTFRIVSNLKYEIFEKYITLVMQKLVG
jgi:hypothetical protein